MRLLFYIRMLGVDEEITFLSIVLCIRARASPQEGAITRGGEAVTRGVYVTCVYECARSCVWEYACGHAGA